MNKFEQKLNKWAFYIHYWVVDHFTIKSISQKHKHLIKYEKKQRMKDNERIIRARNAIKNNQKLEQEMKHNQQQK